ncbi:unnamed protein product [Rangifer tarandus platyrhynchus]|uniref:Uncharacterized protein n=1 Tax=Rangifer tarandus platyrhynchus TaxID=3082113 RepID=A0AC60A534_RANTA
MGRAFGVLGSRHVFRRRAVAVRGCLLRGPGRSLRRAEWSFQKGALGSQGTLGPVGSCWQASLTWSPGGPEALHSHELPGVPRHFTMAMAADGPSCPFCRALHGARQSPAASFRPGLGLCGRVVTTLQSATSTPETHLDLDLPAGTSLQASTSRHLEMEALGLPGGGGGGGSRRTSCPLLTTLHHLS